MWIGQAVWRIEGDGMPVRSVRRWLRDGGLAGLGLLAIALVARVRI